MPKPASVVILPLPLTPAASFGYGILKVLGYVDDTTHIRVTRVSASQSDLLGCNERTLDLRRTRNTDLLASVIQLAGLSFSYKRIFTFACGENKETKELHLRLTAALKKLNWAASRQALNLTSNVVRMVCEDNIDVWNSPEEISRLVVQLESLSQSIEDFSYPTDKRPIYLSILKPNTGNSIGDILRDELSEGRIFRLRKTNISLAVGGPPGAGKSTLATSLVTAMNEVVVFLKTRVSFSNLDINVGLRTLDAATTTTGRIFKGDAVTRPEILQDLKQNWTPGLARRTEADFRSRQEKYNILIGDLPGLLTPVTDRLLEPVDGAIIISDKWPTTTLEWLPFMSARGIPVVAKVRSSKEEQLISMVSSWRKGERLSGQISSMNRIHKPGDPFVQWLANILLFDILPTMFGEEEKDNI